MLESRAWGAGWKPSGVGLWVSAAGLAAIACSDGTGPSGAPRLLDKLVYLSSVGGSWQIWAADTDGSHAAPITALSNGETLADPRVSPDGTRILFTWHADLYTVASDGSQLVQLTRTPDSAEVDPAWSPDGRRIAFAARDNTPYGVNYDIYAMHVDGSAVTQLTHAPGEDRKPAWAPDGQRLAFMSDRDGSEQVYIMSAVGTDVVALTRDTTGGFHPGLAGNPVWSHDGQRIAYVVPNNGGSIYLMRADGTDQHPLMAQGYVNDPAWAPDDRMIALWGYDGPQMVVATVRADGTGYRAFTGSTGDAKEPSYSPPAARGR